MKSKEIKYITSNLDVISSALERELPTATSILDRISGDLKVATGDAANVKRRFNAQAREKYKDAVEAMRFIVRHHDADDVFEALKEDTLKFHHSVQ